MISFANVVVYNYQYMIDPKVSQMVSRELERECIVVFDEAHNIDNVCIEALSVNLTSGILNAAAIRNLPKLKQAIDRAKATDANRLKYVLVSCPCLSLSLSCCPAVVPAPPSEL